MFLQSKINSTHYIAQVVNPVLLPLHRQESDVLFQQDKERPLTTAATQRVLRGVQQLPCPARSPDLSPIEHVWGMMKRELTFSPEPATIIAKLRRVQEIYHRITFRTFMIVCMREYTLPLPPEGVECVLI